MCYIDYPNPEHPSPKKPYSPTAPSPKKPHSPTAKQKKAVDSFSKKDQVKNLVLAAKSLGEYIESNSSDPGVVEDLLSIQQKLLDTIIEIV